MDPSATRAPETDSGHQQGSRENPVSHRQAGARAVDEAVAAALRPHGRRQGQPSRGAGNSSSCQGAAHQHGEATVAQTQPQASTGGGRAGRGRRGGAPGSPAPAEAHQGPTDAGAGVQHGMNQEGPSQGRAASNHTRGPSRQGTQRPAQHHNRPAAAPDSGTTHLPQEAPPQRQHRNPARQPAARHAAPSVSAGEPASQQAVQHPTGAQSAAPTGADASSQVGQQSREGRHQQQQNTRRQDQQRSHRRGSNRQQPSVDRHMAHHYQALQQQGIQQEAQGTQGPDHYQQHTPYGHYGHHDGQATYDYSGHAHAQQHFHEQPTWQQQQWDQQGYFGYHQHYPGGQQHPGGRGRHNYGSQNPAQQQQQHDFVPQAPSDGVDGRGGQARADGGSAAQRRGRHEEQQDGHLQFAPQQRRPHFPGGAGRGRGGGGAPAGARPSAGTTAGEPTGSPAKPRREGVSSEEEGRSDEVEEVEEEGETDTCVICCEQVTALSVGACGHDHVCARCCLRLRMLYKDNRCPLCKAVNDEVVVLRPAAAAATSQTSGQATYSALMAHRDQLWTKPRWAKGVLVQAHTPGPEGAKLRPLHVSLLRMTARACPVCDKRGARPFLSDKQLQEHMRASHGGKQLCHLCLSDGHKFHLELEALNPKALAAHMKDNHPACEFCTTRFYGSDELFAHMQRHHFHCHVCQRQGRDYVYFKDAWSLQDHLRRDHYLCEEPECADCMTAFATEDELRQHMVARHSRSMPRWDRDRARPLLLDFDIVRSLPRSSGARGGGRAGAQQQQRGAGAAEGGGRGGRGGRGEGPHPQEPPSVPRGPLQLGEGAEAEGGLAVIDDDVGMMAQGAYAGPGGGRSSSGLLRGAWAGRGHPHGHEDEEFPALPVTSNGPTTASSTRPTRGWEAAAPAGAVTTSSSAAGLRKVTSRCPCGRRTLHLALREGQDPPRLECDRECEALARRAALADAFGVANPDTHVSYFDRHRTVSYSHVLLKAAKDNPEWMASVEREIAAFTADASQRRKALSPMTPNQRGLVHELAEAYGLATSSVGHEPNRCIQLIKTLASGLPTRSLIAAAADVSYEELEVMAATAAGAVAAATLRLVDVTPGTNLNWYFREWADHTNIKWLNDSTAEVQFTRESAFKAASDALGGGVRGVFRVDRSASARPPGSAPLSAAAVVASRPQPRQEQAAAAQPAATQPKDKEWLVMTRKKVPRSDPTSSGTPGAIASTSAQQNQGQTEDPSLDPWLTPEEAAELRAKREQQAHVAEVEQAADSWEEVEETGLLGGRKAAAAAAAAAGVVTAGGGSSGSDSEASEPHVYVPGSAPLRPPLALGEATVWDALAEEEGDDEEEEEEEEEEGEEVQGEDEEGVGEAVEGVQGGDEEEEEAEDEKAQVLEEHPVEAPVSVEPREEQTVAEQGVQEDGGHSSSEDEEQGGQPQQEVEDMRQDQQQNEEVTEDPSESRQSQ